MKKRKKKVKLDHEQKRLVAKEIIRGDHSKQVCNRWGISASALYSIIQEYLVVKMSERYPDQREFDFAPGMRPETELRA